jgi:hypothetical protein
MQLVTQVLADTLHSDGFAAAELEKYAAPLKARIAELEAQRTDSCRLAGSSFFFFLTSRRIRSDVSLYSRGIR